MSSIAGSVAAGKRLSRENLGRGYAHVRRASEELCEPLRPDDFVVQSMPDASPTKWHLAHTTWFFETLLLLEHREGYRPHHERYQYLFNSYYNTLGEQYHRPERGLLVRPTTEEVFAYRQVVDEEMRRLLHEADEDTWRAIAPIVEIGIHHEQQHQELLCTDIKHLFASNPIVPVYRPEKAVDGGGPPPLGWKGYEEALREIGHDAAEFRYDNETPRHREFVPAFEIASRLVTAGEYLEFLADGAYDRPELWLSDGWSWLKEGGPRAPLYWRERDGEWWMVTLAGERPVRREEPVCHVSFYEADAYARWKDARLPTEAEWETAAADATAAGALDDGNFVEQGRFHPAPAVRGEDGEPVQMLGDVWEWTASPYIAYPGYRAPEGALGEYNAKFMCNQMILRGGSCVTPRSHIRETYRNFFPPPARWQFSGIRLARDAERSP